MAQFNDFSGISDDKLEDLLSKFSEPLSVKERPLFCKTLAYGRPKVGKTTTFAQLPLYTAGKTLLYACDNGWSSLKDYPELADKVVVEECQSLKHFNMFCEALRRGHPRYDEFDHIMIDPFNKLVMMYLDFLQDNYAPSQADSRVHWTPTAEGMSRGERAFTTAGMGDYNALRNYFRRPVFALSRIPKAVTYVAHATDPGFTESKSAPVRAAIPGRTYELLSAEVDIIVYMDSEGGKVTASLSPSAKEDAGSRIRALHGKKINAAALPALIAKWQKGEAINV